MIISTLFGFFRRPFYTGKFYTGTCPQLRHGVRQGVLVVFLAAGLAGCGTPTLEQDYPDSSQQSATDESGSLFTLFKLDGNNKAQNSGGQSGGESRGLAVNADLWRAALDTVSFMPLASTDPIGGVIITDWYNDPQRAGERFKINVVITGLALRADGVRVGVFRERNVQGRWVSVAATPSTARQLENIMLSRARDFVQARTGQ